MNAADHTQQTALHWAAVRGSIAVAVVLLQNGARVEAADLNGYRVILYFNTACHCKKKGAWLCVLCDREIFGLMFVIPADRIGDQLKLTGQ